MSARLAIAIAVLSILLVLFRNLGGNLTGLLLFTPADVMGGQVWQVITYALVMPLRSGSDIFAFLISLYLLYALGGRVEAAIGSRRFLGFYLGVAAVAAIVTVPFAFLFGWQFLTHGGVWVSLSALVILFAHQYAHQPIYLFFALPVQGRQLILLSFGILGLYALVYGLGPVFPEAIGMLCALAWTHDLLRPRRAWLRFRAWRIERELKRRNRRFAVIPGGRASSRAGLSGAKDGERRH